MTPENWLDQLKAAYPKRSGGQGWAAVPRLLASSLDDWETILLGTQNYRVHCSRTGKLGTELVQQARTFYGRDKWWQEYAEMDLRSPVQKSQDTEWEALERRAAAMGFHTVDRSRGLNVARSAIEAEERKRASNVLQLAGLRAKGVG